LHSLITHAQSDGRVFFLFFLCVLMWVNCFLLRWRDPDAFVCLWEKRRAEDRREEEHEDEKQQHRQQNNRNWSCTKLFSNNLLQNPQKEGKTEIIMFATTTTKTNSFSSRSSSSLRKPRSSAKKSINATVRVLYVSSPKPKICQIAIYPLTRVKIDQISTAYAYAYLIWIHTHKQSTLFSLSSWPHARASLTSNFRCHVLAFYFDETNLCLDFISKTRINYYCFV
jgi:hypothetical protein